MRLRLLALLAALTAVAGAVQAQEEEQPAAAAATEGEAPAIEVVTVTLPGSDDLVAALAVPESRDEAFLALAAAAHAVQQGAGREEADQAVLARSFQDDRGWLQSLVERFGWRRPHATVLDPAAWQVLEEVGQHNLSSGPLTFPGAMPVDALLHQVFHRSDPRHAAAGLPPLLLALEADAESLWREFLLLAGPAGEPYTAWKTVETAWFTDGALAAVETGADTGAGRLQDIPQALSKLVRETLDAGPPDAALAAGTRTTLLLSEEETDETGGTREQAAGALYIVTLVEGLHEGLYTDFVKGLLSLTSAWLESAGNGPGELPLARWMHAELPAISARYAQAFARVDPGLDTAMAAAYSVLQDIVDSSDAASGETTLNVEASRTILADAVAALALQIPDMVYYFDIPVRSRIIEQVYDCLSGAANLDMEGQPTMTRAQFDGCLEGMLQLADQDIRNPELSGNVEGPFTDDALRRELGVPPWQRINYAVGYLQDRFRDNCQAPSAPLPNPLEWSVLATAMAWLAESAPGYFLSQESEARIARMRSIGESLVRDLAAQAACRAGARDGDMISRIMRDYEQALRDLEQGFERAEQDFRAARLQPGADVSLAAGAAQRTAYRPDDLLIGPCDSTALCDMTGDLSATRALIGLFPDEYLVADQAGMGRIEICYRNMEWVQRRSELVRPDDENVANYYGRLGFDLLGRYVEGDETTDIFGFRFTSPDEYHYLFAQASEDILQDSCPVEWVGSRVVTPLRDKRVGIVPDRLTYLASARNLPSRLLQNNWDRGAEWRDWFVTGLGVTPLDLPEAGSITARLDQHLQSLYQMEQAEVYQRVFLPNARNAEGEDVSLFNEISRVSTNKAVMRMLMMLFYPGSFSDSDAIRTAMNGDAGLLDGRILRRLREEDTALSTVKRLARERLYRFREAWAAQPGEVLGQGSIPPSVAYAMNRLNVLYRRLVTSNPGALQEAEPQPPNG